MQIAFIGLGRMGRPLAARLLGAGHALRVHDVQHANAEPLVRAGAAWATHPAEAARDADVVFSCVPGPSEIEGLALGERGLLGSLRKGSAWFELSTGSPELVRRLHGHFAQGGAHVLDAPISGGPAGAESGRVVFWVGGDRAVFERHEPLLRVMGDQAMHVGGIGCGLVTKLAHNCANFAVQALLAEVFTLGVKAGVDPLVLFTALRQGTLGRSRTFDRLAEQFLPGRYEPAAFALKLADKDMRLAAELAREHGVPLRMAQLAAQDIAQAVERGWGERDARIALTLQEERAGVSVRVDEERLRESLR